ncbi:MAG: ComEC family competence protein [Endomicrobium sp.]|nr:ComEC family competence protein [Endomicrobium sp.]
MFKRPIITVFIVYVIILVLLDVLGYFSCEKQSVLYKLAENNSVVSIQGRVVSMPQVVKAGKRFVLETNIVNGEKLKEKVIVNSPIGYSIAYGDIVNIEGKLKKPFAQAFPLVFDYQKYLARSGIYSVLSVSYFEYIKSDPNIIKKLAFIFRDDISSKIDIYFKKPYSGILKSLIIGDKSSLTTEVRNSFSDSGVMHVLVVSGLHVGFIGIIVLFILKLFGFSFKKASLSGIPFIFFYVIATGANPPALRAAIMFACIVVSLCFDREPLIYNSLALSALIILVFQPQQLFTASFQMSYGATIGITCFYKIIFAFFKNIKNKVLKFFCATLSVTISAQIVLMPICMYYFGKISIISFVANIMIVPLTAVILYLGVVFYVLTFIFQYASVLCSDVISMLLNFVLFVTMLFGKFKFASIAVQKPSSLQLVLFFVSLFSMLTFKNMKRLVVSGIIIALNFAYVIYPFIYGKNKIFFNIYEGKSITVLQIKNKGKNIFIVNNKSKYYDEGYMSSFKQYLAFSGIKKADVIAVGFNKNKVCCDLMSYSINLIDKQGYGNIELRLNNNFIVIDDLFKRVYINNVEFLLNNNKFFIFENKNFK